MDQEKAKALETAMADINKKIWRRLSNEAGWKS